MALQDDYIIIDGYKHTNLPTGFSQLLTGEFGVLSSVSQIFGGRRIMSTTSKANQDYEDYRDFAPARKIAMQAWSCMWSEESLVTPYLAEQLQTLFLSDKSFWLQYDAEMSRCWGRCLALDNDIADPLSDMAYWTPTFPVFPLGTENFTATLSPDWSDSLWVGRQLYDGSYDVYPDTGLVVIHPDGRRFSPRTKVHLKYTWKAYVRLRELRLVPYQITQSYYTGEAVFEQVPVANVLAVSDRWYSIPTASCVAVPVGIQSFNRVALVATANAYADGKKKDSAGFGTMRLSAWAVAEVNTAVQVVAQPVLAQMVLRGSCGSALQIVPTAQSIPPTGVVGAGWRGSTTGKTLAELITDNDISTYIYGSTVRQLIKLAEYDDPMSTSDHTITVNWRRGTSATTNYRIRVLEGARQVATHTFTRSSDGDAEETFTLTSGEAGSISDYTDLYVEFSADYKTIVTEFEFSIPANGGVSVKTAYPVLATFQITASGLVSRTYVDAYPVLATVQLTTGGTRVVGYSQKDNQDE